MSTSSSTPRWPLVLLGLLVALAATRFAVLQPDVVFFGVDTMSVRAPFADADGASEVELLNPALADQGQVFYPYYRWVSESWRAGDPPWWNPFVYLGAPGHANAQCGALDPQVLALVLLDAVGGVPAFDWGLGATAFLRVLMAFLGAAFLARKLGLGLLGSATAGVGFALSGFQVLWLNHSLGHVSPYLPWILYFLERLREGARFAPLFVAGSLAGAVLAGHPETSFYVGLASGLWALLVFRDQPRAGLRGLLSLGAGALIGAIVLLPFVEYLELSAAEAIRSTHSRPAIEFVGLGGWFVVLAIGAWFARLGREASAEWQSARGWPLGVGGLVLALVGLSLFLPDRDWFDRAALVLLPDRYGSPADWNGPVNVLESASPWLPAGVLVFAIAGLLGSEVLRRRAWIAAGGFLAWALSLEAPGLLDAYRWVPLVGLGATVRLASVSSLMLSLLAGDALENAKQPARVAAFALVALGLGASLAGDSSNVEFTSPRPASDELCAINARPADVLRGEDSFLEVSLDENLELATSLEVRVEPLSEGGHVDPNQKTFFVQLERAATSPPGRALYRTQALVTSRLAEGKWRFTLEATTARGTDFERFVGESLVVRQTQRPWITIGFVVGALVLASLPAGSLVGWLVLVLALAQGLLFAFSANPLVPRDAVFPETQTAELLADLQVDAHRVLSDSSVLPPGTGLVDGLYCLQGYDGMDPRAFNSFRDVFQVSKNGLLGFNPRGVDLTHPAFQMLGVGQLLLREPLEFAGWTIVAGPGREREAEVYVAQIDRPFPRAWATGDVTDPDTMRERVAAGASPRIVACVEEAWRPADPMTTAEVTVVERTNNTIRATVETDGDALVVFSEQAFPGWSAKVNGEWRDVLDANYVLRGVAVEEGVSEIELIYSPDSLRLGAIAGLAGFLLMMITLFIPPVPR